jgi:hypothetical protein
MAMSRTLLSQKLLDKANISENQELWILQQCNADYSQYETIRRALRRIPALDTRHGNDAGAYYQGDNPVESPAPSSHNSTYNPFSASGLQRPAPDPPTYAETPNYDETYDEQAYPVDEEDSDDDDFLSADENDDDAPALAHAWIIHRGKRRQHRKGGKGKGKRRGKRTRGKGGTWYEEEQVFVANNRRNYDDNPPQGWTKEKWIARTPCDDCGSRWHYSCKNKKGGKQGGGGKKGGKGKHGFGVFMMSLASLATSAQSYMFPSTSHVCQPCFDTTNLNGTCAVFDEPVLTNTLQQNVFQSSNASNCFEMPDDLHWSKEFKFQLNSSESLSHAIRSDSKLDFVSDVSCPLLKTIEHPLINRSHAFTLLAEESLHVHSATVLPAAHFVDILIHSDPGNVYAALEPLDQQYRKLRAKTFKHETMQRWGLLLDTGAPTSCAGQSFIADFCERFEIHDAEHSPHETRLSGIGSGSATVRVKVKLPVGLCLQNNVVLDSVWECMQLEGCGSKVPPLVGLHSMINTKAIINTASWPYVYSFDFGNGRQFADLDLVHGHLILPCDWGGMKLPPNEYNAHFVDSTVGLPCWWNDTTDETTDTTNRHAEESSKRESNSTKNQNFFSAQDKEQTASTHSDVLSPGIDESTAQLNVTSETSAALGIGSATHELPSGGLKKQTTTFTTFPESSAAAGTGPATHELPSGGLGISTSTAPRHPRQRLTPHNQNWNTRTTSMHQMFSAVTQVLKKVRITARQLKVMSASSTYHKKYKGLPSNTPFPVIDETGQWDIWEWWWGGGPFTKTCEQEGLRVGPPIGHQSGWCIKLPHHRAELKRLLRKHKPRIILAAPTCGIWSSSNTTLNAELKLAIQAEELGALEFLAECCYLQVSENRDWLIEQPKSSEMLRTDLIKKLTLDTKAIDNNLCMCCHELRDPESHLPCMKPTTL